MKNYNLAIKYLLESGSLKVNKLNIEPQDFKSKIHTLCRWCIILLFCILAWLRNLPLLDFFLFFFFLVLKVENV